MLLTSVISFAVLHSTVINVAEKLEPSWLVDGIMIIGAANSLESIHLALYSHTNFRWILLYDLHEQLDTPH